ncbi:cytochrome P450 [Podospora australis]|uniref:Cytochrome P450 n=1 Tax=Podospora australis TaxID=1536484 RepID=A0AAN6WX12_9PEZI|nr:cytochrome P450 [Podospora australis]
MAVTLIMEAVMAEWRLYGLLLTATGLFTYLIVHILYNIYLHPLADVPGPLSWRALRLPYVRSLVRGAFIRDTLKMHLKYGPIVRVAPDEISFAGADAATQVLTGRGANPHAIPKDPRWTIPGEIELGLVTEIDHEVHARIRKLLAPAFTPAALRSQEPILQLYSNLLIDRLREKAKAHEVVDMVRWFNFISFDIFGDLAFGESWDCLQRSEYHSWIAYQTNTSRAGAIAAAPAFYPWLYIILKQLIPASLMKRVAEHIQFVSDKIQKRLNLEQEREDIMSHVLKSMEREDLGGVSMGQINTTFVELNIAGTETSASLLSAILRLLLDNPDKLAMLTSEIRQRFPSQTSMTLESLKDLPYLDAVIREGGRLCPPVPWLAPRRVPPGDAGTVVCGTWLPGGTSLSVNLYAMHLSPMLFHSPNSFVPERWLPEATTDPKSPCYNDQRQAVQIFTVGPRACIGRDLAWAEQRLILAKLLWEFDLESPPGEMGVPWIDQRVFMLIEKAPVNVVLRQRMDS